MAGARTISVLAPVVTAAMMLAMIFTGRLDVEVTPGVERYHASVREAIERIPYRVGTWVGTDLETPTAAVRLLKPNKILQRRYTDPATGRSLTLLVVHCGDVRDMEGHYPPVCYPAHGWTKLVERRTNVESARVSLPATEYEFSRVADGIEQELGVTNFFVLPGPGEQIFPNMDAVNRAGQNKAFAALGAAQIQVLDFGGVPESERLMMINAFVQAVEPAIRVIAEGVQGE